MEHDQNDTGNANRTGISEPAETVLMQCCNAELFRTQLEAIERELRSVDRDGLLVPEWEPVISSMTAARESFDALIGRFDVLLAADPTVPAIFGGSGS